MSSGESLPVIPGLDVMREQQRLPDSPQQPSRPPISEAALVRPFGTINRMLLGASLACALGIIMCFSRIIDLGSATVNWSIQFDVNWALFLVILLAGVLALVPRAVRNRAELHSSNTVISAIITLLAASLFFAHVLNLGTFFYTQKVLDFDTLALYAFCLALIVLAQRGSRIALLVLGIFIVWWAFTIEDFNLFATLRDLFTSPDGARLAKEVFPPLWKRAFVSSLDPLFLTIKIAIGSTLLGVTGALPLSFLAARNTTPHPVVYNAVRAIVNVIRAVPSFFIALLLIPFIGLGAGPAILGLGIHAISTLTKIFSEAIEAVRREPLEALSAVGANGLKSFRWGVFPQAFPLLASYSLYTFESIVRDSTVLAFVGGGGIGFLIYDDVQVLQYGLVAVELAMLIVAVILLDRASDYLRSKII